jgi:hypothetical protein
MPIIDLGTGLLATNTVGFVLITEAPDSVHKFSRIRPLAKPPWS